MTIAFILIDRSNLTDIVNVGDQSLTSEIATIQAFRPWIRLINFNGCTSTLP